MKKNQFSLVSLFVVLFSIMVYSCDSTTGTTESQNVPLQTDSSTQRLVANNGIVPMYHYEGNVQFRVFGQTKEDEGNEVTFYFLDNSRVNFVILQNSNITQMFANGNFEVDIYESGVVLHDKNQSRKYFYGIDDAKSEELVDALGRESFTSVNNNAKGFVYNWGTQDDYGNQNLTQIAQKNIATLSFIDSVAFDNETEAGCDSGGAGASSCSVSGGATGNSTGCSVSCNSGYYACCNKGYGSSSCKCKAVLTKAPK